MMSGALVAPVLGRDLGLGEPTVGAGALDLVDVGLGGEALPATVLQPQAAALGRERGAAGGFAGALAGSVAGGIASLAVEAAPLGHVLATALGPVRIVVEGEAAALRVTLTAAETAVAAFDGGRAALAAALQAQGMRLEALAVRVEALALTGGGDVSADSGGGEKALAEAREFASGQDFGRGGGSAGERAALAKAAAGFGVGLGSEAVVFAVDAGLAKARLADRFA
jgi:hypothetical protein